MNSKNRFSINDALIIVMVFLCVMGILFRETVADSASKTVYSDTAEIHFTVEQADMDLISSINSGDIFYFENGAEFGTLLEGYSYKNTEVYTANEHGTPQKTVDPEKYELSGILFSNGRFTDNGFLCGTEKIFINSEIKLHSQKALCVIKVVKIENASSGNDTQ